MKKRTTILASGMILFILCLSCSSRHRASETADGLGIVSEYEGVREQHLSTIDTVLSFEDEYPVDLEINGDKLYVTFIQQDSTIKIYDKRTGSLIKSTGIHGNGPEDVLSPEFFSNRFISPENDFVMRDSNGKSIILISDDSMKVEKKILPGFLHEEASMNYTDSYVISNTMMNIGWLFNIWNLRAEDALKVQYPFDLTESALAKVKEFPTILSPFIYYNKDKGRIIATMYFIDACYAYKLDGTLINTVSLSGKGLNPSECIESYLKPNPTGCIRYVPGYGADDYCYAKRVFEIPDIEKGVYTVKESEIVKFNWDGEPQSVITVSPEMRSFCVDGDEKLYSIVYDNHEGGFSGELYHIIRYSIE